MASDFKATQAKFAGYIRNPAQNPAPVDVDPQRMAVYRELFFNNIDGFLSINFPVIRRIYNDQQWLSLAEGFFADHACQTPHFSEIAEEFLSYLQNRDSQDDYPFLLELAHYEWVEMALAIAKAELPQLDAEFIAALPERQISVSELAWPLVYRYPVQLIAPDFLPLEPPTEPTYLIVYRDQHDKVHFLQSNPVTFRLLEIIQEHPAITGRACLEKLAVELPQFDPKNLFQQGLNILREMAVTSIITPAVGV